MEILNVPEMHCEMCVKRISEALQEKNIGFEISLENKTVSVEESRKEETLELLDDLGF